MATRQLPTLSLEAAYVAAEGAQQKAKQMGIGRSLHPHIPQPPKQTLHIPHPSNAN